MAKNLFSYGKGKRDISHSKFDMSFNSLRGDNFGSLSLEALYETLPDDFWHLSHNTMTKVAVMNSPAFTRIHQNHYAFYVRNQQVWEHWNNYITNGTAFGDVYGSNLTNQKNDNLWQVPSIPANDLQLILKIAHGFAIPVQRFSISFEDFFANRNKHGLTIDNPAISERLFYKRLTFYFNVCAKFDSQFDFLNEVPYYEVYYGTVGSVLYLFFELFGSQTQINTAAVRGGINGVNSLPIVFPEYESDAIGQNTEPNNTDIEIDLINPLWQTFRLFSDNQSSEISLQNSPFLLTRNIKHSRKGLDLNDFDYSINKNSGIYGTRWYALWKNLSYTGNNVFHDESHGDSVFRFHFDGSFAGLTESTSTEEILNILSMINPDFRGTTNLPFAMLDNETTSFSYQTNYSWMAKGSEIADYSSLASALRFRSSFDLTITDQPGVYGSFLTNGVNLPSDVVLPIYADTQSYTDSPHCYYSRMVPVQHPLTDNLGYFSLAFLIYQCMSVASLLDDFNIPVDALAVRNTLDYRFESFNALPFFGYSKIWNDHFRNLAVSSPELDYRQTNGLALFDQQRRAFLNDPSIIRPEVLPEFWADKVISTVPVNSWVIPFCAQPKTGITENYADYGGVYTDVLRMLDGKNHYINIRNYVDLFCLLTGYFIDNMVLDQLYYSKSYVKPSTTQSSLTKLVFADLFTSKFYLPNYYNGLLHKKYQNFNKDYFSSAMLDPMSGANQVELGSTVNELRTNEAKQGWFERIAQARSVKGFFNAIFGITPELENLTPQLCGSDHVDINIGEVVQTSQTDQTPQGTRTGLGSARGDGNLVHQKCNEHGFILVLVSHTVESQYFQGVEKMWLPKKSYMDYPTIDFANIGNESILQKELNYGTQPTRPFNMADQLITGEPVFRENLGNGRVKYNGQGNPRQQSVYVHNDPSYAPGVPSYPSILNVAQKSGTSLDNVFGYVPRYSTYKFKLDQCHGVFKYSLKYWQSFRKFNSQPILSHEFVNWEFLADSEELNKMFVVQADYLDSKFLLDIFINSYVSRALPYVCTPHSK